MQPNRLLIALLLTALSCIAAAGASAAGPQSSAEPQQDGINQIVFSRDGKLFFTLCNDGSVGVWDAARFEQIRLLRPVDDAFIDFLNFDVHPQLPLLALTEHSDDSPAIYIVDYTSGNVQVVQTDQRLRLLAIAFSPDGRFLAAGGLDGVCNIYKMGDWKQIESLQISTKIINAVAWHPQQPDVLALGSFDRSLVEIWSLDGEPRLIQSFKTPGYGVCALAWLDNGKRLLCAGYDGNVYIYDPTNGTKLLEMHTRGPVHGEPLNGTLATSAEMQLFAIALDDETVEVFDLRSGRPKCYLEGAVFPSWCLAFDQRGKYLYTGAGEGELQRWRIKKLCR